MNKYMLVNSTVRKRKGGVFLGETISFLYLYGVIRMRSNLCISLVG